MYRHCLLCCFLGCALIIPTAVVGSASADELHTGEPSSEHAAQWVNKFRSLGDWWRYQTVLGTTNDGKQLLIGSNGKHLFFYDLTKGKVDRMLITREGMQSAALSPDGKLLAVAEWRDGFTLRDATGFGVLKSFSGSEGLGAWEVRFNSDGRKVLCHSWWHNGGVFKKQIFALDLQSDQEMPIAAYTLNDADGQVRERFSKHGTHLLSVEKMRKRGRTTGVAMTVRDPLGGFSAPKVKLNKNDFHLYDVSRDGRRAIVHQPGEPVRIVDTRTGEVVTQLAGRLWTTGGTFSPDGRLVATVRGTKFLGLIATQKRPKERVTNIVIHDALTGQEVARLDHPKLLRDYYQVGFSRDGQYLFSITAEKDKRREVILWGNLPDIPEQIDPLPTFEGAETPPPTPNRVPIKLMPTGAGARLEAQQ